MVPIYETDLIDEKEPSPADWRNYELWEKIELRQKRVQRLWILATILVFTVLLSVPTVLSSRDQWRAQALTRQLAQKLVEIKTQAATQRMPHLITFAADGSLHFSVEVVAQCPDPNSAKSPLRYDQVLKGEVDGFRLLNRSEGDALGIPGLIQSFCYNPILGPSLLSAPEEVMGFGVVSVKDLTERQAERVSILLLKGESAEISFN